MLGPSKYAVLKLVQMDHYVDFWNVMTYDFSGSWDWIAGHDANIYPSTAKACSTPSNADQAISHYITSGINPSKVIMGIPLYGRSFTNTAGPGSSFQGVGRGSWENGVWDYKALPRVGAAEYILEQPVASYSYDENTKTMISYDTPEIARLKARYIKARGLGGAMWWESSGDKTGNASLIGTVGSYLILYLRALSQNETKLGRWSPSLVELMCLIGGEINYNTPIPGIQIYGMVFLMLRI